MKKQFTMFLALSSRNLRFFIKAVLAIAVYFLLYALSIVDLVAQPTEGWDRTFGSNTHENLAFMQQISDGEYNHSGLSFLKKNDNKGESVRRLYDNWQTKPKSEGETTYNNLLSKADKPSEANKLVSIISVDPVDNIPPVVTSFSPEDDAIDVDVTTVPVITFNEIVKRGSGKITFTINGQAQQIDVQSEAVIMAEYVVTFNLPQYFPPGATVSVQIEAGAITDMAGNPFAGISSANPWNFTTASLGDNTAPVITKLYPAPNSIDIPTDANLIITFDEVVAVTDKKVRIYENNIFKEEIAANSFVVSLSVNQALIVPPSRFAEKSLISIQIEPGAFLDLAGNDFAGITDNTTWSFTTADYTSPLVIMLSPADNANNVDTNANLVMLFDEEVKKGSGAITINQGMSNQKIHVSSAAVTIAGNTVTINPPQALPAGEEVSILIEAGTFTDEAGNPFAGISDNTNWSFTTTDNPAHVEQSVDSFTLVDADTDKDIREIRNGDVLNLAELSTLNFNIRANTTPREVGSVVISLNGRSVVENHWPYAYAGGSETDYIGMLLPAGDYTLTATPYHQSLAKGKAGKALTVKFKVVYQAVESFVLVDADSDKDLIEIKNGEVINLALLPTQNFNIRANTTPKEVGSVIFNLNGSFAVENLWPYAYAGGSETNYNAMFLPVGEYTLTATPYTGYTPYNATTGGGLRGRALTVSFKVVYEAVESFTLVDADTDKDIREIRNGDVLNLAELSTLNFNIRANTTPREVGSVVISLNGRSVVENHWPYAYAGGSETDYIGMLLPAGDYTLTATPYHQSLAKGKAGKALTVKFTVVNTMATARQEYAGAVSSSTMRMMIHAHPNPFVTNSTVEFSVPDAGNVLLNIYDTKGLFVGKLFSGKAEAGKIYTIDVSSGNLQSGVYVIHLTAGKHTIYNKLILTK